MENKEIKFKLSVERVFYFYKDGKAELIIANKNFSKFRTLDQLIEMKGDVTNEIVGIKVGEISDKIHEINLYYDSLFQEKMFRDSDKNGYFKKLKPKKLQEYRELEQKCKEEINSIIAEPNKFLKKCGYEIEMDGSLEFNRKHLDDGIIIADAMELEDCHAVEYFLRSGEKLINCSYLYDDLYDDSEEGYFESIDELKTFKYDLQEEYNKTLRNSKEESEIKENNEKYLEF